MKHVLLLHGALGTKDQWEPVAKALASDFEVHLFNFPGHGGEETEAAFSIASFADAVLQWQEKTGIHKLSIIGYSMGGYVAMYLAAHYPEKVDRIVTLATKYEWNPDIAAKETGMLQPDKIETKVPQFAAQLRQQHAPADWKKVVTSTAQMLQTMGEKPPLNKEDFARVRSEVLLLIGDRDKMVTLNETASVYHQLQKAQLGVLPNTPHPLEAVDEPILSGLLRRFLG